MVRVLLLALAACLALPQVADAAYVDVQFRPQNGDLDTATEWAYEMISDTPIGSTGIYIPNAGHQPLAVITPAQVGIWPRPSIPGIRATIDAIEDPMAPWGFFDATWFGLPAGLIINAGPGSLSDRLGPVDTWLFMGMLFDVTYSDILAGAYVETGLWEDNLGNPIPASDVQYTFPEPAALLLLTLGLTALALLRKRRRV